jgi:hypothetical protein
VTASDADGTLPAIAVGGLGDNSGNLFSLQVSPDCLPGHLSVLNVDITFAEGGKAQVAVPVTFGTRTVTDPVGPDAGGYYAFDNGDLGYGQAPVYEWVEIDPALGGPGQSVGLTDFAIYSDDTRVVDLPFPFTYYGRDFSKISICSNGWFAMGATYQRHYRNRTLPAVESPEDMVCVYWDELYAVSGDGGVFTWYDAVNHRFIIEWRRMRNEVGAGDRDVPGRPLRPGPPGRRRPDPDAVPDRQPGRLAGRLLDGRHPVHFAGHGPAVLLLERLRRRRGTAGCRARHHVPHLCAAGDGRSCRQRDQRQRRRGPDHGRHGVDPRQRTHAITSGGLFERSVPIGTWNVAVSHPSFAPDTTYGVSHQRRRYELLSISHWSMSPAPCLHGTAVPASTSDTEGPYVVTTTVTDFSGVASMRFFYTSSTTGGPFELPLTTTGQPDQFQAAIPGQAAGTRVQFWLEGADVVGNLEPPSRPAAPSRRTASSWRRSPTWFPRTWRRPRAGPGALPGDNATSGTWTRVDPNAVYLDTEQVQPEDDHSPAGTICWVTGDDPAGSSQGAADVDGGTTTLPARYST